MKMKSIDQFKINNFDICIHYNVPHFSSLHNIINEAFLFQGYYAVFDNKI